MSEENGRVCHNGECHLFNAGAPAMKVITEFEVASASRFGLRVCEGGAQRTAVGYDVRLPEMLVDRRRSGESEFDAGFPDMVRPPGVRRRCIQ